MYKVNLQLEIWDSYSIEESENWVVAYKQIELPFTPFIGLEINFPRGQRIKNIRWNVEGGSFTCSLEDQYCLNGIDDPVFDEWIEYYRKNEWLLNGPFPKNE